MAIAKFVKSDMVGAKGGLQQQNSFCRGLTLDCYYSHMLDGHNLLTGDWLSLRALALANL